LEIRIAPALAVWISFVLFEATSKTLWRS